MRSTIRASSARSASWASDISSRNPAARGAVLLEQRLRHDGRPRDDLLHPLDEVTLVDLLGRVGSGLGRGDLRRLEHGVLDVAPAPRVALGERVKIDVVGEGCLLRVELDVPDPLPLRRIGHLEQDMGADPALERRIHVGGEIGREDDDAGEGLQLVQEHVDHRVGLAVDGRLHEANRRPAMVSDSSKKSTASCRSAARNTEATCLAVCPTHRDSSSEYRTTSSFRWSV